MFCDALGFAAIVASGIGCGASRSAQPMPPSPSSTAAAPTESHRAMRTQADTDKSEICGGEALPPDQAVTRFHLFEKACGGGDEEGCRHLALAYACGSGVAQDSTKSIAILEKSCARSAESCDALGVFYLTNSSTRDLAKAKSSFQRACDAHVSSACSNLGTMYMQGTGVPADNPMAVKLFKLACDGGSSSGCENLATMYLQGAGVAQDAAKAAELYRAACDKGNLDSCANLGVFYLQGIGVQPDEKKAVEVLAKACESGGAAACDGLGMSYWTGTGVPRDEARARDLFKRGCDRGFAAACDDLRKPLSR